jgi:hypothetical protein
VVAIIYRRKLSAEDAETGTILIEKAQWRRFPAPMQEFGVRVGALQFATRIVAEDCACVPPPHQHYHLEANHFRDRLNFARGAPVAISHDDNGYAIANE